MFSFNTRLEKKAGLWPKEQTELLNDYLKSSNVYLLRNSITHKLKELPYWISLPCWIHYKWKTENLLRVQYSLEDLLWAQFCVYLSIKIGDDELDGQTNITSSGSISKLLLTEAEFTLSNYFAPSANFWKYYHDYLIETNSAISSVNELQHNWSLETDQLEKEYYLLSSALKIATLAIFSVNKKQDEFEPADNYLDEMSTGGQILDDFLDYEEDLHSGKLNYAARILLSGFHENFSQVKILEKIIESIIRTNNHKIIFDLVRSHYNKAHDAAMVYHLVKEDKYHSVELMRLNKHQNKIHHDRVRLVLGDLM
ncbi:MAG: hypothetical protein NTX65_11575 [Ignavibacteriales bacterium]|nr:hypothetical protein [Ignavibacteriales bacterium]